MPALITRGETVGSESEYASLWVCMWIDSSIFFFPSRETVVTTITKFALFSHMGSIWKACGDREKRDEWNKQTDCRSTDRGLCCAGLCFLLSLLHFTLCAVYFVFCFSLFGESCQVADVSFNSGGSHVCCLQDMREKTKKKFKIRMGTTNTSIIFFELWENAQHSDERRTKICRQSCGNSIHTHDTPSGKRMNITHRMEWGRKREESMEWQRFNQKITQTVSWEENRETHHGTKHHMTQAKSIGKDRVDRQNCYVRGHNKRKKRTFSESDFNVAHENVCRQNKRKLQVLLYAIPSGQMLSNAHVIRFVWSYCLLCMCVCVTRRNRLLLHQDPDD